ncbi:MAG: chemotaxis protein CheX [Opitutales bacterium]
MSTSCSLTDADIGTFIQDAVEKFFATMLEDGVSLKECLDCTLDSPQQQIPPAIETDNNIIASAVGYLGDINGIIYLYFEEPLAKHLTGQMLGMEPSEVESEGHEVVNDALGEVSNMVVGTFKNHLCDKGLNCRLTIPSILRGKHFAIEATSEITRKIFRFETAGSIFAADLLIKMGEAE